MIFGTTKVVGVILMMLSGLVSALGWIDDRPTAGTWFLRLGGLAAAALILIWILWLHFRPDYERDYLRDISRQYFNRDGFCFTFAAKNINGIAYIYAFFQSQRNAPSVGQIALRPARGFFLNRAEIETIVFYVECPPAAFGAARMPIPIPAKFQGKRQSFEVGASVNYPEGRGNRIRFRDGFSVRANSTFEDSLGTLLTVASVTAGHVYLKSPATQVIQLPTEVTEEIPEDLKPEVMILWQLGDPQIESFE